MRNQFMLAGFYLYQSFLLFFQALSSSAYLLQVLDADLRTENVL